jgi:flavin reductase (DIM6/NTAB) family NADH-FMN oxidoreductase RutF
MVTTPNSDDEQPAPECRAGVPAFARMSVRDDEPELPADCAALDEFARGLDYTMLLVTTRHQSRLGGCLVGFATQTSIDPFRYLVCLSRNNATTRLAQAARHVAVHQLSADQSALARLFGGHSQDEVDKFASCSWAPGPAGMPLIKGCPVWLVGRILSRSGVGDHIACLLAPVALGGTATGSSLRYSQLPPIEPGREP